jgi:hypothetical protein
MIIIQTITSPTEIVHEIFPLKALIIDSALSAICLVGILFAPAFLTVPLSCILVFTICSYGGRSFAFLMLRLHDVPDPDLIFDEALDDHIAPLAQAVAFDAPEVDDPNNNLPNPTIKIHVVLSEEGDPI